MCKGAALLALGPERFRLLVCRAVEVANGLKPVVVFGAHRQVDGFMS